MAFIEILKPFRTIAVASAVGLAFAVGTPATAPVAQAAQGPESVADLAEKLLDAVVNISTSQRVSNNRRTPHVRASRTARRFRISSMSSSVTGTTVNSRVRVGSIRSVPGS